MVWWAEKYLTEESLAIRSWSELSTQLMQSMQSMQYTPTESSGCYNALFKSFADALDEFNDRRERVVKASRDTTRRSKKIIFELHRVADATSQESWDDILQQAQENFAQVQNIIARGIANELSDDDYPRLHHAFSPGLQEYAEAALFLHYLRSGALITREQIDRDLQRACARAEVSFSMYMHPADYILGVADLSGELMRLAIGCAARGNPTIPVKTRDFLSCVYAFFSDIQYRIPELRELDRKIPVFCQSLDKVINACFQSSVRKAETASLLSGI